jgi:hypothetical protein
LNKKYGIAAIIACAIIVGVLALTYSNNASRINSTVTQQPTNSTVGQQPANSTVIQQPANPVPTNPPAPTGRHFSVNVNETVSVRSNP